MSQSLEVENQLIEMLIIYFSRSNQVPTHEILEQKAEELARFSQFDGDLTYVVEKVKTAIDTRVGAGEVIVDNSNPHDRNWPQKREIDWTYFNAYERYLKLGGWPPAAVEAIATSSERILGLLRDPKDTAAWKRRGLVIGHVQSGKTANYLGLITKAADAGYKVIIVVAGIHNNLRRQTQQRIEEGFIGRTTDPARHKERIGVGQADIHYPCPVTFTTVVNDFNKKVADSTYSEIKDFSKPIVLVIKKNVSTLKALHEWLDRLNARGGIIGDHPMLMIDDEADNASINTNKEENDPTKTNAWLRKILSLFAKSCYVGYTATPFANIFINPDAYTDDVKEDLFPSDFIYALDAPNTYFGPHKVFLDENTGEIVLRKIYDCEEYIPLKHKKELIVKRLPDSLLYAFKTFVLAKAIRNLRGQKNRHCSMLINVSRFVPVQRQIRDLLGIYAKSLRESIKANYAMSEAVSLKDSYMRSLKDIFESEYSNCGFSWSEVKKELYAAFETLGLFVINSESEDHLDYLGHEKAGAGLTAVAIGGFTLSRGLTLEGLCVSYMYRNTQMYDTLMQMGRWFGYRLGYEDLCRIFLSPESISWYEFIADKTEELRKQIRIMRRDNLTPRDFGLYVETHPDTLKITAANKMRNAVKKSVHISYCGKLREAYRLSKHEAIHWENMSLINSFCKDKVGAKWIKDNNKTPRGWYALGLETSLIYDFIANFVVEKSWQIEKDNILEFINEIINEYDTSDVVFISQDDDNPTLDCFRSGTETRSCISYGEFWETAKDRVASRGDEKIGLSSEQIEEAEKLAEDDEAKSGPSDAHYRRVRGKPLLMIHFLRILDRENRNADGSINYGADPVMERVPTFGISFPYGDYSKTITVAGNRVWALNPYTVDELEYQEDDSDD